MSQAGANGELRPEQVRTAVAALSKRGVFRFTARHLYYKLLRDGAWPDPEEKALGSVKRFERVLEQYEQTHGPLDGLLRRIHLPAKPAGSASHDDIADYTVRRIVVFDRVEPFLMFAANGFHQKLEIGLALWPDYPHHVWKMHERNPDVTPVRTFYVVHDCNREGYQFAGKVRKFLEENYLPDKVVDVGLKFRQVCNLGLPIRTQVNGSSNGRATDAEELVLAGDWDEARLMFHAGHFVHLEELSPLQMLRWTYRRIAKRQQDVGFG